MKLSDLPTLGQPIDDGIFAGITTTKDGKHWAVILLNDKPKTLRTWSAAMKWAAKLNAVLPDLHVSSLLAENLWDLFEEDEEEDEWYWTRHETEVMVNDPFAYVQSFRNGGRHAMSQKFKNPARAVRLISLE